MQEYRKRSLNAERRTQSPLKLSLQHGIGAIIKTPSASTNLTEFSGMTGSGAKNWTSEVKAAIGKLSSQKMRANHYA